MTETPAPLRNQNALWLWSETAVLSVLLAELSWLSLWYEKLAVPVVHWAISLFMLASLFVTSYIIARILDSLEITVIARRFLYIGWTLVAVFLSMSLLVFETPPASLGALIFSPFTELAQNNPDLREIWHTLVLLIIVYRGLLLARRRVNQFDAVSSFQAGLLMFVLYSLGSAWDDTPLSTRRYGFLYAFLFFGLISLITARISRISELRGGRLPPFGKRWALNTTIISLAVVGLALFAAWFMGTQAGAIVTALTIFLLTILTGAVLLIFSPLLTALINGLPRFGDLFSDPQINRVISNLQTNMESFAVTQQEENATQFKELFQAGQIAVVALVVAGILALIFIAVRSERRRMSLTAEDNLSEDPAAGAQDQPQKPTKNRGSRRGSARQYVGAARIRYVYHQLQNLGARLDTPRANAWTPLEYLPRLADTFGDETEALTLITHAYNRIRYGMLPETDDEVKQVLAAWQAVERKGRKLLRSRP